MNHLVQLQTLASAEGNILENKNLLDSLNKTKASSMTIAESLQDAHRIQTTLDQVTMVTIIYWTSNHSNKWSP